MPVVSISGLMMRESSTVSSEVCVVLSVSTVIQSRSREHQAFMVNCIHRLFHSDG